jgi:hypothetical protein
VTGFASTSAGELRASTAMTGTVNAGFRVSAGAVAQYEDKLTLRGGFGASTVLFQYMLHGAAAGFSGPGYYSNDNCGLNYLAGRLDFTAWTSLYPDGSPAGGHAQSSPCHDGDGSTIVGAFGVPYGFFTDGSLAFQMSLVAFGQLIMTEDAEVDYASDFSHTASLTGVQVLDAAGNDITGRYTMSFAGPGLDSRVTATPEPASLALTATGFAGLAGVFRRRRKTA